MLYIWLSCALNLFYIFYSFQEIFIKGVFSLVRDDSWSYIMTKVSWRKTDF